MKERPILFSAPMVRAILAGTKTQTRRWVMPQPAARGWAFEIPPVFGHITSPHPKKGRFGVFVRHGVGTNLPMIDLIPCPYGQPGDRLWVRESFCPIYPQDPHYNSGRPIEYDYRATYKHGDRLGDLIGVKKKWKPSIHMPRRASRITLEVTGVRVERLQDISEADAVAEGVKNSLHLPGGRSAKENFAHLWWTINGEESWEADPWVWVLEFKRLGEPAT